MSAPASPPRALVDAAPGQPAAHHCAEPAPRLDRVRRLRPAGRRRRRPGRRPPAEENTTELAERLREHLARLVTIAVASGAEQDTAAAQLVLRARTLHADSLPRSRQAAMAHLRRLGWTANELHDRLTAIRCLKEAA